MGIFSKKNKSGKSIEAVKNLIDSLPDAAFEETKRDYGFDTIKDARVHMFISGIIASGLANETNLASIVYSNYGYSEEQIVAIMKKFADKQS
jgi:hypothetical protein